MRYLILLSLILVFTLSSFANERVRIKAIAIPLADHYAAIVAYEKYRTKMREADFKLLFLKGPKLVRAYFNTEDDADIAFNVSPMVMDMFSKNPNFKWVSLIHRDGNALTINSLMNEKVKLPKDKKLRKPDAKVANAFSEFKKENSQATVCAVPSPLATHTTILYKYLKDHNKTLSFNKHSKADLILNIVKPPLSPVYLKKQSARSQAASFEQSLPWPEIANMGGKSQIAWYSKDVMNTPKGHVECIIIAKNSVIEKKNAALKEVIYYIHKAGQDIEKARTLGGQQLEEIIKMITRHIPAHTPEAIKESLNPDIMAINYKNLNIDQNSKDSFDEIMNLAYEAGFIKSKIDINKLTDDSFNTTITQE
ncbi:MAG: nitrate ABC transporter substrate-binding protein [Helicobacteraceae bacterium]|nr:nitrate ABC transporter substrate-binding protein [Helicobacteraceae bacterium]